MKRYASLSVLTLTVLAGCAAGPDYQAPEMTLPQNWRQSANAENPEQTQALNRWWLNFGDPVLEQLVDTALAHNNDLKIAFARIEEARAQSRSARADFLPTVVGNAGASRNRSSTLSEPGLPPGTDPNSTNYRLNIDLSYEIDLWGKLRRADEAATARLLASEANRDAVRQALIAQVARSYFDLRTLDAQLDITRRTLRSREDEFRLQKKRFDAGVLSELELNQAQVELNSARIALPDLEGRVAMTENALSTLLGQAPTAIGRGKALDEQGVLIAIPAGLPSELLRRRPDLRAAEQELIAANADIGYAKAAYYPSLSLTGLFGFESGDLSNLLKNGARTWNAGAGLMAPLFLGGKAAAAENAARARHEQALARYQQSVFEALREVEDALVQHRTARTVLTERETQEKTLQRTYSLAQKRYRGGLSSYLDLLLTERSLFQTQLDLLDSRRAQAYAAINLYRALGGDWGSEQTRQP